MWGSDNSGDDDDRNDDDDDVNDDKRRIENSSSYSARVFKIISFETVCDESNPRGYS